MIDSTLALCLIYAAGTLGHWANVSMNERHAPLDCQTHSLLLFLFSALWPVWVVAEMWSIIRDD